MIKVIKGNIFNSAADCVVSTVNCVGFMGKGIALEMSIRYPEMEQDYKKLCALKEIKIGELWMYDPSDSRKKVLNFPTKYDYKYPSKIEYIEQGLKYFISHYKEYDIESIAFSVLGATNGKIPLEQSLLLMRRYLDTIKDLRIEVYINDRDSLVRDSIFNEFLNYLAMHETSKNKRIYDLIVANPSIITFTDIIDTKISEEQPDGTYRHLSIATKKYIQEIVMQMNSSHNQDGAQFSFLV